MSVAEQTVAEDAGMVTETPESLETESFEQFDYTPMSPLAPISFLLALVGLTAFLGFYGNFVALAAAILAVLALRRIRASEGAMGGLKLAKSALVISVVSFIGGTTMFSVAYATECPEGYERVNFPRQIAEKMFTYTPEGQRTIHEEVQPFLETPIFLKGYVYQTRATTGRRDFILLKDSGQCCFGGDPAPYDMIHIRLAEDHETVEFPTLSMVSVAGILTADPSAPEGAAVYTMEAHQCERARTSF